VYTVSQVLGWLGEQFNGLKETALAAWQGISAALAAGDIGLAARILWLTLKLLRSASTVRTWRL